MLQLRIGPLKPFLQMSIHNTESDSISPRQMSNKGQSQSPHQPRTYASIRCRSSLAGFIVNKSYDKIAGARPFLLELFGPVIMLRDFHLC